LFLTGIHSLIAPSIGPTSSTQRQAAPLWRLCRGRQ
jgi:hypothetical protein